MSDPAPGGPDIDDGVQLRTHMVGPLPLLLASAARSPQGTRLHEAVVAAGLSALDAFIGVQLPQGAKVGFVIEPTRLRMVNDRDESMLLADRAGLDQEWIDAALAKKGTMFLFTSDLDLRQDEPLAALAGRIDDAARSGLVLGAIVGVVAERPTLPMLF